MEDYPVAQKNINLMKGIIANEAVKERVKNIVGKEAGTFLASCLDLYTTNLTSCDPNAVFAQCLKAAALHLPVSNALGFCYVVPYKNVPTFTLGYRGLIQLAQRTGLYKYINADMVYEGEEVKTNRVTGMVEISGEPTSDNVIGYFAYFQLLNGFEKCVYWTKDRVYKHGKRYSKSFENPNAPWKTNFDAMALKTVIRQLISKYGVMSIEFAESITNDNEDEIEAEVNEHANGEAIRIDGSVQEETKTITAEEKQPDDQRHEDNEPSPEPDF